MTGRYDAVVVGAGPAGSVAAASMAEQGLSVLLLEALTLPRDKPCGGGVTGRARRHLPVQIDDLILARARTVQVMVGPRFATVFRPDFTDICMVRRTDLDARLAREAERRGAVLHDGEPVVSVEMDEGVRVVTKRDSYSARVLVGADGAESKIARRLGFSRPRRWMVGLEAEVALPDRPPSADAVVDFDVPGGYAWLFPRGASCGIGVVTSSASAARGLRARLAGFASQHGIPLGAGFAPRGHRIPAGLAAGPLHMGTALLAGDAAGTADPLFGEGISYALLSGRLAANSAASFLAGKSRDLAPYTVDLRRILALDFRVLRLTASFVHRFPTLSVRLLASSGRLQRQVERTIDGGFSFGRG